MPTRALVLGGGGLAGIAWELGVLVGLADAGIGLTDADLVVGTSAGSVVGSVMRSRDELAAAYEQQLTDEPDHEIGVEVDMMELAGAFGAAMAQASDPQDAHARIAAAAAAADTVPEATRLDVIKSRLPSHDWPAHALRVTAIEAPGGTFTTFDRDSGVPLVLAVAASCAVPLVWPPMTIDGRRYIDGGLRSTTNADLAVGYERVLVIAPFPPVATPLGPSLADEIAPVEESGRMLVVAPNAQAVAAFGLNPLDPSTRRPSALVGRAAGAAAADEVRRIWTG